MLTHTLLQCFSMCFFISFFEKKKYIYNIFAENFMSNITQSSKADQNGHQRCTNARNDTMKNKAIMTNKMRVANKTTNTLVFCKV